MSEDVGNEKGQTGNSPHHTICAFSYHILDIVLLRHVEGNLPGAAAPCWSARHGSEVLGDLRGCATSGVGLSCRRLFESKERSERWNLRDFSAKT